METKSGMTLVLGGTGKTGRRVVERLRARGLPVRVGSRTGTPRFDWEAPETWGPALEGVTAVYLAYAPDLGAPGAREQVRAFAAQAAAGGVQRIVLLSGRGEPQAHQAEEGVRTCGVAFTVLRAAWFFQNFSEGHLLEAVRAGELAFPAGEVAEPFLDAEDIAEVAVAALTDGAHAGRTYELTGPRLLTFAQAAAELSEAVGRPVRYVPLTPEAYAASLAPYLPQEEAEFLAQLFCEVLDGRNADLADGVQQVLGRAPRDFRAWARETATAGAWSAAAAAVS
ncbi:MULTISPECIES: NAD(P)H-binding protein [Myxococcaceae]|uniref:NmrA family NAD(P)-binding protein n=1 Tax=Myxococcaceae TaxID=31 RepID=UPI001E547811|nr:MULTISPECIES: NAD(P)H-binding protein [Myxococcaceae]